MELDADVLSLNEVQYHYHKLLVANQNIKYKYPYISEWSLEKWKLGGTILSKYPMRVFKFDTNNHIIKRGLLSLIDFPNGISTIVINAHLISDENKFDKRAK